MPVYTLICVVLGLVLGWIPKFLHGPIPEKFNLFYLHGEVSVWGWYAARMMIGLVVGITCWPRRWYLRGPLCGFLMMLPPGVISLGVPTCGGPCMFWNETSATVLGLVIAGIAFKLTGKHHVLDQASSEGERGARVDLALRGPSEHSARSAEAHGAEIN